MIEVRDTVRAKAGTTGKSGFVVSFIGTNSFISLFSIKALTELLKPQVFAVVRFLLSRSFFLIRCTLASQDSNF